MGQEPSSVKSHDVKAQFTEDQWVQLVKLAKRENRTVKNLIETIVLEALKQGEK